MKTFKSFLKEAAVRGVNLKALKAEKDAYKKVGKLFPNGKSLVAPAGFDHGFPDFAYRTTLKSGKVIDVHFEYKQNAKAQMGSMRDWIFDGQKFTSPDMSNESKQELIYMMNNTPTAIANGKRLLKGLQTHVSKDIKRLYSGSLGIIKDKMTRKFLIRQFMDNMENYTIATVKGDALGNKIVEHYKKKFVANLERGSDASILLMMLDDTVWIVDTNKSITSAEQNEVAAQMGLTSFTQLKGLSANLECRIQPRSTEDSKPKPASIDVMANFRLSGRPAGGGKII